MKSFYTIVSIILVGALFAFVPTDVLASTYGKVTGSVQDENGNPLPGANVVVEGTQRGATSDADGSFLIIGVPPGEHEVTASMVGYGTSALQRVLVQSDFTTTISFSLTEAALEATEMVVTAQRPPVEVDRTSSRYVIDIFEIENVPLARSAEDLIELEPGVSLDGALRIRGRSNDSQTAEIDGVRLIWTDGESSMGGRGSVMATGGINKGALQEVSILTGGMDAEYGHSSSRVSFVTQDGGSAFSGMGEYRLTPPGKKHWGRDVYESGLMKKKLTDVTGSASFPSGLSPTDYTGEIGHYFEGSVGGPISDQAAFFGSVAHSREATVFPEASLTEPFNIKASGNVTFRPMGDLKLKVGGMYSKDKIWRGERRAMTTSGGIWGAYAPNNVLNLFLPADWSAMGQQEEKNALYYAVATHSLNPKTFWEFRAAYSTRLIQNTETKVSSTSRPTDEYGFTLPYDYNNSDDTDRTRWIFKGDITSQLHKNHLVKAGFEHVRYSVLEQRLDFNVASPNVAMVLVGFDDPAIGMKPGEPNQYAAYVQDKMEFEGLVINAGVRIDAFQAGDVFEPGAANWMHYQTITRHRHVPLIDHGTMWSVSPRIGISHPISERATVRFFTGRFRQLPSFHGFWYHAWVGSDPISLDLNNDGSISQQTELYNRMTLKHNGFGPSPGVREGREQTMEVGADWNFAGDYVGSLTMFYADKNGTGSTYYMPTAKLNPVGFRGENMKAQSNEPGFDSRRGFELSFKKMFSQMTSFAVSWNIQWVAQFSSFKFSYQHPGANYVNSDRWFLGVDINSDGSETPRVPTAAERAEYAVIAQEDLNNSLALVGATAEENGIWLPVVEDGVEGNYIDQRQGVRISSFLEGTDRRNYGSVQFLFSAPTDFHITALQGFRATLLYRIQQGTSFPYTPVGAPPKQVSGPASTVTDVNFEKDFSFGQGGTITGFLEVKNIWNQRDNVIFGGSGFEFSYMAYGLQTRPPDDPDFLAYGNIDEYNLVYGASQVNNVHNTYRYFDLVDNALSLGEPRLLVLGARLRF